MDCLNWRLASDSAEVPSPKSRNPSPDWAEAEQPDAQLASDWRVATAMGTQGTGDGR